MKALILSLMLTGCASPEYWKAGMFEPIPGPTHEIYTSELPQWYCAGREVQACWIKGTAFVYLLDTLRPSEEECYLHHEVEMHKNRGYGHEPNSEQYDICGYATLRKQQDGSSNSSSR